MAAAEERFQAGFSHLQNERYSDALVEFQRAATLDPTDPRPHHGQGNVYHKLFLVDRATESFRKAVELDPNFLPSKKRLATLLHDAGEYHEAVQLLEPLAKQHATDTFLQGELAINLLGVGEVQRAIALLEKYNEAEGKQAWGYAHLGRAYSAVGDLDRAESLYRQALALDPHMIVVRYWLGQVLVATGREEESRPLLERYRMLRDLKNQEHQLRMTLLREQDVVGTLIQLARVLYMQGKTKDSLATLERAREMAPDDEQLEQLYRKVRGDLKN